MNFEGGVRGERGLKVGEFNPPPLSSLMKPQRQSASWLVVLRPFNS